MVDLVSDTALHKLPHVAACKKELHRIAAEQHMPRERAIDLVDRELVRLATNQIAHAPRMAKTRGGQLVRSGAGCPGGSRRVTDDVVDILCGDDE
jgi:hypothetical protein